LPTWVNSSTTSFLAYLTRRNSSDALQSASFRVWSRRVIGPGFPSPGVTYARRLFGLERDRMPMSNKSWRTWDVT